MRLFGPENCTNEMGRMRVGWLGQFKSKPPGNGKIASDKAYDNHFKVKDSQTGDE